MPIPAPRHHGQFLKLNASLWVKIASWISINSSWCTVVSDFRARAKLCILLVMPVKIRWWYLTSKILNNLQLILHLHSFAALVQKTSANNAQRIPKNPPFHLELAQAEAGAHGSKLAADKEPNIACTKNHAVVWLDIVFLDCGDKGAFVSDCCHFGDCVLPLPHWYLQEEKAGSWWRWRQQ